MDWESEFFQRDRNIHPPALTPEYKTSVLRSLDSRYSPCRIVGSDRAMFGENELGPLDNDHP